MSVIAISTAPDRESYDKVSQILDLENQPAAGLLLHAAGMQDDGEVRIVQVFDSSEAIQAFVETRLMPAFGQAGVMVDRERAPRPLEAFQVVTGAPAHA